MTTDRLHTRILQECQRAEEAADKAYEKKLRSEEQRHGKRLADLEAEREQAKAAARAMRAVVPGNGAPPADTTDAYAAELQPAFAQAPDDGAPPDLTQVPEALREPYVPKAERLTGGRRGR